MKTSTFSFLVLLVWLAAGCSATKNVRIPVQVAPQVILPEHIQSLGLVNRSLAVPTDQGKVVNVLEGVVTGEGYLEDRQGSLACLAGAHTQLNNDNLVTTEILDTVQVYGTGTGIMPLPLPWSRVEEICRAGEVDALLVLEVFDTDQAGSTTANALGQIRNIAEGGTVQPPAPATNPRVRVKVAWRLYDPVNRTVLDEVRFNDYFGVGTGGYALPDLGEFAKRDAIQQSGYLAGRSYGNRMYPTWIRLVREFYQRKGDQMERATRHADVNEWDEAAAIWEGLTQSAKRKTAGRAAYNLAIVAEVQGDIERAIEWANRSYTVYGEKRGRDYARLLRRRL